MKTPIPLQPERGRLIRPLAEAEYEPAMALVSRVFDEFEAPEYRRKGVRAFRRFIAVDAVRARCRAGKMRLWGCYDGESLAGVGALRDGSHICLLFVEKAYHRQGIGEALAYTMEDICHREGFAALTVHSSPYAVAFYRRLGFQPTDEEQTADGIRYTPMRKELTAK